MFFDNSVPRLKVKVRLVALPIAMSMLFLGASLANADDIFLQIEGIEGGSVDNEFRGAIEALEWSWGVTQDSSNADATAGRAGAGRANVHDLRFTHYLDSATPRLYEICATGRAVENARLTVRKLGGPGIPPEYVVIDLKNVYVTSINTGGEGGEDRTTEEVSLSFSAFQFSYKRLDRNGKLIQNSPFGWDLARNTKTSFKP